MSRAGIWTGAVGKVLLWEGPGRSTNMWSCDAWDYFGGAGWM